MFIPSNIGKYRHPLETCGVHRWNSSELPQAIFIVVNAV